MEYAETVQPVGKLSPEMFLNKCTDFGLFVLSAEEFRKNNLSNEANDNSSEASSPDNSNTDAEQPNFLLQVTAKTAGQILNELGQRSGILPVHGCDQIEPQKFKHTVYFDQFSASCTRNNKKVARNSAIEALLKVIPSTYLQQYIPSSDLKIIHQITA